MDTYAVLGRSAHSDRIKNVRTTNWDAAIIAARMLRQNGYVVEVAVVEESPASNPEPSRPGD